MPRYRDSLHAIQVLRAATRMNFNDPKRRGNVIHMPRRGEFMVTGDLHGNIDNYERIVEIADLGRNPARHVLFQEMIHGGPTTTEGGCKSFKMLEQLAVLKADYPDRVHIILGNHELAEVTDLVIEKGQRRLTLSYEEGLKQAYGADITEVRHYLAQFIRSMPLAVRTRNKVFASHSIPRAQALLEFDRKILKRPLSQDDMSPGRSAYHMVWGRDLSEETAAAWARIVKAELLVVGHKPCSNGYAVPNSRTLVIDSKDENGRYLMMPLSGRLTMEALLRATAPLYDQPRLF